MDKLRKGPTSQTCSDCSTTCNMLWDGCITGQDVIDYALQQNANGRIYFKCHWLPAFKGSLSYAGSNILRNDIKKQALANNVTSVLAHYNYGNRIDYTVYVALPNPY